MRPPRHVDRVRTDEVDDCRRRRQILGRLEPGVALPDDENFLVDKVAGVDGDLCVFLGQLDAGYLRDVGRRGAGGDNQAKARIEVPPLIEDSEGAVLGNPDCPDAVFDFEVRTVGEVLKVIDEHIGSGEIALAVVLENQIFAIAEQGIPVPPEIDLRVVKACEDFIDRDQLAVARIDGEEGAGGVARLQYQVVPPRPLEKVAELQTRRACADD